jgi:hypothetical protein
VAINTRFNTGADNGTGGDTHSISRSVPAAGGFGAGTLSAGDILVVQAIGGSAAGGLNAPVVSDNISGTTGWHKLSDSASYSAEFRSTWWWKLAVGGEATVTADWTTPGTHRGIVFIAVRNPGGLDEAYLIIDGAPTFTGGYMKLGPGAPSSDGEMYVGGTGMGPHNYTFADIDFPPGVHDNNGVTGDGFNNGTGDGVAGIIHINDNVAANLLTDALTYRSQPIGLDTWDAFIGLRSGPGAVGGHSTGGLFLGDADPTVTEHVSAASSGGLFLGAADGEPSGFETQGASEGGLLTGTLARGTVVLPFPPVPPVPAMTGILGCGIYDVFIFTRGLATIVGRIPFNQLQWERVLDDTSTAQVTVNGVSNAGAMGRCCALLGSVTPWEHEIGIYRDGLRVWSGPVMDVTFPSETVVIDAADLSAWLSVRWLHDNHNDVQQDLANIWVEYVSDAMGVENSAGLHATVQALTGVLADRLYTQDMGTFASDAIAELARTGLDWSCVDRVMTGGPVAVQPPAYPDAAAIPTLIDESFRQAPTVLRSGSLMGNAIFVGGSGAGPGGGAIFGQYGPHFPATVDHVESPAAPDYAAIEAIYGRIERRVNETKILDQPSIDQNAATRYDLLKTAVDVISDGTLLPTAGIDLRQLTPGSLQNIHLQRACVQIGAPYRLKKLTVTAANDGSEDVVGSWEPVGSIAAHEDL